MISHQVLTILKRSKTTIDLLQIRALLFKTALDRYPFTISRFVLASSSISLEFTRQFFESLLVVPPNFAWNTIIRAYTSGPPSSSIESVKLFASMLRSGLKPNNFTYTFAIKACGICSLADYGSSVHSMVLRDGLGSDKFIGNTLLRMYGACNEMVLARQVFDEMTYKDVASWNSMIATYVACKFPVKAIALFREMNRSLETPSSVTLTSVLSACSSVLNLNIGRCIHSYIIANGVIPDVALGTSLLEMYAECGLIDKAIHLFNSMAEKNLQSWTIMISNLANHGHQQAALDLFAKMSESGLNPDSTSFVAILSACSYLGLVEEGRNYFDQMTRVHGIRPNIQHYGCMVDMYGRAGMIQEAYELIRSMKMKPNCVILSCFIGSCKNHGFDLPEGLEESLVQMEPEVGANDVSAASLFEYGDGEEED